MGGPCAPAGAPTTAVTDAVATAAVHCGACRTGLGWVGRWARPQQSQRGHLRRAGWPGLCSPHPRPVPGPMAPRPLSPLVLALGGAAAVLGSVLFILWKTYFGRGRQRRWDRGEGWWGAEPARFPEWDEWEVSVGPGPAPPRERPRGGPRPCERGNLLVPGLGVPTSRPSGASEARNGWPIGWGRRPASQQDSGVLAGVEPRRARPRSRIGPTRGAARSLPAPAQCARLGGCWERSSAPSASPWLLYAVSPTRWSVRPWDVGIRSWPMSLRKSLELGIMTQRPLSSHCIRPLMGGGRAWELWCLGSYLVKGRGEDEATA